MMSRFAACIGKRAARRLLLACLFAMAALIAAGCSGAKTPQTAGVQGKVSYRGQPVTQGVVLLTPEGSGQAATGEIQTDGSFQLTTFKKHDGARPGKYRVAVQPFPATGAVPGLEFPGGKPPIPAKYLDVHSSGLTAEIKSGKNTLELTLSD